MQIMAHGSSHQAQPGAARHHLSVESLRPPGTQTKGTIRAGTGILESSVKAFYSYISRSIHLFLWAAGEWASPLPLGMLQVGSMKIQSNACRGKNRDILAVSNHF